MGGSGLFERALERMLVLPRKIHHLVHLRLGDFIAEDAANADAALVDVEHDAGRFLHVHAEKALQEFGRRAAYRSVKTSLVPQM